MLHPAFADHHVHLGLVDASGLAGSGIGRVVDLGWSDDVVALASSAPVAASYAGRFVTAPGGYPSASRWAPPRCTSEVAEPRDAAAAVAHQVALGASVVKVTLNRDAGPVPDGSTLRAVVEAAADAGLPVVAHCQGPGMVELGLAGGIAAVAHTPWTHRLDDEVVAEAVEAGQAWVSTLDIHGYGTPSADQDRAVDNLARFRAAGGRVLYGTDLGNGPLPRHAEPPRDRAAGRRRAHRRRPAGGADRPLAVRRPRRRPDRGPRRAGAAGRATGARTRRTRRRSMTTDPLAAYRDRFVGADDRPRLLRRQLARAAAGGHGRAPRGVRHRRVGRAAHPRLGRALVRPAAHPGRRDRPGVPGRRAGPGGRRRLDDGAALQADAGRGGRAAGADRDRAGPRQLPDRPVRRRRRRPRVRARPCGGSTSTPRPG